MSKRIEIDGKFFRLRRGELVQIPDEWVGKSTHKQTIRKRPSKKPRKQRAHNQKYWGKGNPKNWPPRLSEGRANEKKHETED